MYRNYFNRTPWQTGSLVCYTFLTVTREWTTKRVSEWVGVWVSE